MRARSLTPLLVGLFGATALLVVATFALLLTSVIGLRDDNVKARRSSDLLTEASAVERSVLDLETGLRGYLLTRQRRFLEPYRNATARLPRELAALRRLAADAIERRDANQIEVSIRRYLSGYAQPLTGPGIRLSDAQAVTVTTRGKQLVDVLRTRFDTLGRAVLALRTKQRDAANSRTSTAVFAAAFGLTASILLLLALGSYVLRDVLRSIRRVAATARRLAAGDLSARAPEGGRGEVAVLGHSFNVMASVIQARDAELSNAQERLRRAVAAAREASQMKSNFLSNMSHEIRTPLNGLIGMLALLAETEMTGEQREYVELASASGDALMTVVNDVLDIAKIEAGRLEIESRDFDLDEMVESSCEMVAAGARIKGIELQSYVHDEVPRAVRGDRVRVSQILVNLLSNAVKFTPAGEVVAEVTLGHLSETGASVIFSVRDTGIGIPPERLEHLFEPFTQAEAGTTREFGGTGLGLSISRELAQLMGGTLHARSEVATGSTFQFEIPFARAETDLAGPVPSAELRGLRVLIVDDNETNRRIFEAYVESWGMRATCAADANTAFAHLRHAIEAGTPFDVALLDQNLPGESGVELARRITAAPTLGGTRLILLSSSAAEESWPGVQFACQLTKPVRRSRLLDAISAAMAAGPAGRRSTAPTVSGAGAPPGTGSVRLGCRILVAEDQSTNWMLIDRLLSKRGHVTANAADGEETLRRFDSEAYDLILMDCQMPRCDGYDTAREIRRREGAANGRRTPIIALTAHSMAGDRERCLAAGMDDYLAKPIRAEELDQVLARWLPAPEPPVPADADPLTSETLDPARLAKLRGLFSDEELAGVLRQLMADITEELEGIEAAVRDGDPDEAAAAAHRLRNSALLVGANQLIDAAAPLERSSAEGASDLRGVDSNVIGRLRRHWEMTRLAIENELEPTSP